MQASYTTWDRHGEPIKRHVPAEGYNENDEDEDEDQYDKLLEDHQRGTYMDGDTLERDDVQNFEKMLEASQCGLYPGCKETDTLLSFAIQMLHVKVEHMWSNMSFNKVLEIFRQFLPEGHKVPGSIYECKKLLCDLGLGYELIDACKNDCALFWKENAHLEKCPTCQELRYKIDNGNGKKIPQKILRYFPLTPRLRKLYMSRKTAEDMRWHSDKQLDDGIGRHPSDFEEWKQFDQNYPEFAKETRNVRLGLATDGFQPFWKLEHFVQHVAYHSYSLQFTPWKCMKDSFFMMPVLIPGPHQPGTNIDVFLRPLIDELIELWETGVRTYDAFTNEIFQMRVALMWTINDFPAYGDVSGWRTKGYLACPICNDDQLSVGLTDKIGWVGHRSYLHAKSFPFMN